MTKFKLGEKVRIVKLSEKEYRFLHIINNPNDCEDIIDDEIAIILEVYEVYIMDNGNLGCISSIPTKGNNLYGVKGTYSKHPDYFYGGELRKLVGYNE